MIPSLMLCAAGGWIEQIWRKNATFGSSKQLWVGVLIAASVACASEPKKAGDGCLNGICGDGATSAKGGTKSDGAGGPGGESQAGKNSGSGGVANVGGSGSSGGGKAGANSGGAGACVEKWLCTPWETNGTDDKGSRTCSDENDCGTDASKPVEQAQLPKLDLNYYKCNIEPIANRKCSMLGCHGTEKGRALRWYARGKLRAAGAVFVDPDNACLTQGKMTPSDSCIGAIECRCYWESHTAVEWQRNFDAARGFALDAAGAPIPAGKEDDSELIAQPIVGGKAHAGIHLFKANDPEHVALKAWLSGSKLASCATTN